MGFIAVLFLMAASA